MAIRRNKNKVNAKMNSPQLQITLSCLALQVMFIYFNLVVECKIIQNYHLIYIYFLKYNILIEGSGNRSHAPDHATERFFFLDDVPEYLRLPADIKK